MDVVALVVALLGLGLAGTAAGVFFTFSNSVMPGLDAVASDQAINTMNTINAKIINPPFLAAFVGTPIVAVATGVLLLAADGDGALWFLVAGAVYLLGAVAPTAAVNVPMNNALAAGPIPADEAGVRRMWMDYSTRWTRWNHWRAVSSLATLVLMGIGLV